MNDLEKVTKEVQKVFGDTPVHAVGGCVRDTLLKRQPKDFDYCINLDPDSIEAAIKAAGRRAYAIGKKFGTLGFKVPIEREIQTSDATPGYLAISNQKVTEYEYVEVTTFRKEVYTKGSRKPEVEFVNDLKEDLSRRDFTINAIAYVDGDYFDPFGGRIDILENKIKAVGEATDRFKEDPLRMLRAARFAAQLGFTVDPNMIGKIRKMPETILTISRERWVGELDKLLCTNNVGAGMDVLVNTHLLRFMIPELALVAKDHVRIWEQMITDIQHCDDLDLKWAYLLEPIGKLFAETKISKIDTIIYKNSNLISAEIATGITKRLKFSNERSDKIADFFK